MDLFSFLVFHEEWKSSSDVNSGCITGVCNSCVLGVCMFQDVEDEDLFRPPAPKKAKKVTFHEGDVPQLGSYNHFRSPPPALTSSSPKQQVFRMLNFASPYGSTLCLFVVPASFTSLVKNLSKCRSFFGKRQKENPDAIWGLRTPGGGGRSVRRVCRKRRGFPQSILSENCVDKNGRSCSGGAAET